MSAQAAERCLSLLLACLPDSEVRNIVDTAEDIAQHHVCPLLIGLVGGLNGGPLCSVWPLMLPLAPYLDRVLTGYEAAE
jgi:hypothetical protein